MEKMNNDKGFDIFSQIVKFIIKYFKWVMLFAVVLIVLSGVFQVESNEVAVVLRFGRLLGNTPEKQIRNPGLHFSLPFFIDEVIKVPVQIVHEREIITHYAESGKPISSNIESNGYLLTGDNNIVLIKAMVKYTIGNAVQYALYSSDTGKVIDGIVSGELTRHVVCMDIDSVLTIGRAQLSSEILKKSQIIFDELKTGVKVISIELIEIVPPAETKNYFEEVISASVNKETAIQRAKEHAGNSLIGTQIWAANIKGEAINKQTEWLNKAHVEMAEFNGLYDQYVRDPQIILTGNFRQRITELLGRTGRTVIISERGQPPFIVLP